MDTENTTNATVGTQEDNPAVQTADTPALDAKNCKLVLPEKEERVAAQLDHFLSGPLKQAGYDDRSSLIIVLVTANQCCQAGAKNVEFAGYDKSSDRVVVQTDEKNKTICVDAEQASKADPAQELAELKARVEELEKQIQANAQKQSQDQQQAAVQAEQSQSTATSNSTASSGAGKESSENEKKTGFFQWLGKAIDTFREKVQTFVKEFLEHPFETIGKAVDCALGMGRHNEQSAQQEQAHQEQAVQTAAAPVPGR